MQPVPLLPILSGYCVGFLARCLDIWSHYLIALVVGMIVAQLESLAYFFVRKHQTIANITRKHVVAKNVNDAITMMLPFFPLFGYMSFCKAGMKREEQMEYVKEHYPEYVTQFSSLPNFAIYEPNFWFYLVISFGFFGGIFCGCIFTYTTIDMFQMLRRARRKISATNFRRHRSTVKSLLAQFAASSLLLIPLFGFSVVILSGMEKSQFIIHVILAVFFVEKFGECVGFDCHDTSISKFCDEKTLLQQPGNRDSCNFNEPQLVPISWNPMKTTKTTKTTNYKTIKT